MTPIDVLDAEPDHRSPEARARSRLAIVKSQMWAIRTKAYAAAKMSAVVAERVRDRERRDEEGRHRGEDRDPDGARLGVDDARQPGVPDPRPPEDAEHEQALDEPFPYRVFAMSAVHCVRASTKTRSKKSSSGVTRSSSRCSARTSRERDEASTSLILACRVSCSSSSAALRAARRRRSRAVSVRREPERDAPGEPAARRRRDAHDGDRRARRRCGDLRALVREPKRPRSRRTTASTRRR